MNITPEIFINLLKHCSLVHHIKGRLRVRVSSTIKDEIKNLGIDTNDFKDLNFNDIINNIKGINNVKFNKLVGSLVIEYDNSIFPKEMWDDALIGKNIDNLLKAINKTIEDIK
ncbi:hypothetical protein CBLAS_1360 [Campylobacter blaseri]|uniref:Uncharacterized protein n=1 Tax=Campylobacter blaseri TaxID=2042961 RepID=A0A2P8QZ03_9BACT|nr:hypothetical protein [Campylobacter blaseri]PSM51467.1 hypothetical protein CQ405_07825 [Campylobacter blaseri]PSM52916.1 hypothetical protein CRN67_07830 [Campylobacter blaseri]QKF86527.1 hypothetical protein CBLAS_1360 [Campylobacter blaseri]